MNTSFEADTMRMYAYGYLARFWLDLGTKEDMYEDEAKSLLLLQQALIERFEKSLRPHLDDASMKEFHEYVDKFKVRIVFTEDQKPTPYLRRRRN